ncbi:hypothetical protein XENOCAPTIV_016096 [Xenoophorus captivus]|uniref:Uncharacterized protein n=1 Tax=Xenoophorus captivus TaxID=1517983 RepID=A0ABV0S4Q5_9TELE
MMDSDQFKDCKSRSVEAKYVIMPKVFSHLLIQRDSYVSPPSATITASTLLGFPQYKSVFWGIFHHSSRSAFVRSDPDEMLAVSAKIHPKVVLSSQVKFFLTELAHSVSCLYGPSFVHCCMIMLEEESPIPKLFPLCREHKIKQMRRKGKPNLPTNVPQSADATEVAKEMFC